MKDVIAVVLLVTVANDEEARTIGELLLNKRKIACVNMVPKINSLFWWNGKIESEEERLLIIKSKESLIPEIVELVKSIHSYDVPEIIALPIIGGNEDYLQWIFDEIAG